MCYESDGLFRKLRALERMRKDNQKTEAAREVAKQPPAPPQHASPADRKPLKERTPVSV